MSYWRITPYANNDADYCVLPARTEADHRAALEYAKDRLEAGWDDLEPGGVFTVTIELCLSELPDVDAEEPTP